MRPGVSGKKRRVPVGVPKRLSRPVIVEMLSGRETDRIGFCDGEIFENLIGR